MSEEKMREALPSDSEIAAAFDNTNFGSTDYKGIVLEGLRKTALGYHNGWTLTQILRRLGLADARGDGNVLNKRGFDYVLQAALQESEAGAGDCVCGEPESPNTVHRSDGPCYQSSQECEAGTVAAYVMKAQIETMKRCGSVYVHLRSCLGQQVRPNSEYIALYAVPPSAQAIETAAIMKCVKVCGRWIDSNRRGTEEAETRIDEASRMYAVKELKEMQASLLALLPQDELRRMAESDKTTMEGEKSE